MNMKNISLGIILLLLVVLVFGITSCIKGEPLKGETVPESLEPMQLETSQVDVTADLKKELGTLAGVTLRANDSIHLDVPLIDQMDNDEEGERLLFNGCEVTSMAMLLQSVGSDVTKEALAEVIKKVPLWTLDGEERVYGNPDEGFVGSLDSQDGEEGYSVYHGPVVTAARSLIAASGLKVIDLTGRDFDDVLKELISGHAVWCITTVNFAPTENWEIWKTDVGPMGISWDIHSVVLVGFDDQFVYINDPYGDKGVAYDRQDFKAAWEQMGSQAVVAHS
ncbi:MAG: C39 family peptidase [Raoultibacter sp.]